MTKLDKQISDKGFQIRQVERVDWIDVSFEKPITFVEYVYPNQQTLYSDNVAHTMDMTSFVQIILSDESTGRFSLRVFYEAQSNAAFGGGREYGTIVRWINAEDLEIFVRKAKELQRQYTRKTRIHRIFGRG